MAGGFVGIGRYPREVRERLVTIVPPGPWKSAFFMLPSVGDGQQTGISQVDLQVRLKHRGQTHGAQTVVWRPEGGWIGRDGKPRIVLAFGLLDLRRTDPKLEGVTFESVAQITVRNDVVHVTHEFPLESDLGVALIPPLALAKVVRVDGSGLDWKALNAESDLLMVSVVLRSGQKSFTGRLAPRNINGQWAPPEPLVWIVPRGAAVTADIRFVRADGTEVPWKRNGTNLAAGQEQSSDLLADLLPDWRKP